MAEPEPDPLSGRSLPELREMLLRQERLLGDRAVVSRLPDGGDLLRECAARLRAAVAEREWRRRRSGGAPEAASPAGLAGALAGLSLGAAGGRRRRGAGARPEGAPRREKRRPEDASAARLPPLRHPPARLLPLAESVAIQVRQEEARQEMQAKVAAQKLAERLGIKAVHYEPEGQMMTGYREVQDEEGDSSAEDCFQRELARRLETVSLKKFSMLRAHRECALPGAASLLPKAAQSWATWLWFVLSTALEPDSCVKRGEQCVTKQLSRCWD